MNAKTYNKLKDLVLALRQHTSNLQKHIEETPEKAIKDFTRGRASGIEVAADELDQILDEIEGE